MEIWQQLVETVREGDSAALERLLKEVSEGDLIHALARLPADERGNIIAAMRPEQAASVLELLPDSQAVEAIQELSPEAAAPILEELQSDQRADLVAQIDRAEAEAILAESAPETAESVRRLLEYPPDSAGGRMLTEYVAVPSSWTVRRLIEHLRQNVDRYADFGVQYVYALGDQDELVGVLPLRDLLLARESQSVAALMIRDPISVEAGTQLEELFELFDRYSFLAIPVVDRARRLVGVLLREDVDEARVDVALADELKSRGIVGGEELRTMPLLHRARRRLSWLSLNILLNVVAASVIAAYQDTLAAVIALAVFLPIISDMSGCSGNQAVAVSLREMALGVVKPKELLRVWGQELTVGCLNGFVLGCLIGVVAWAWQGNPALGAVVGVALALNTMVAVSIGGTVPLALKRFGFDPALASGPILTTVTDMCGFLLVLGLAASTLARLAG